MNYAKGKQQNHKRLHTIIRFHICNIPGMIEEQKWRTGHWLPGVKEKTGGGKGVGVALKG